MGLAIRPCSGRPQARAAATTRASASSRARCVAHDAPFPHFGRPDLELRLDEADEVAVRAEQRDQGGQNQGEGDKRQVGDDQVERVGEVSGGEGPGIDAFAQNNARVGGQGGHHLPMPDVHGVDRSSPRAAAGIR